MIFDNVVVGLLGIDTYAGRYRVASFTCQQTACLGRLSRGARQNTTLPTIWTRGRSSLGGVYGVYKPMRKLFLMAKRCEFMGKLPNQKAFAAMLPSGPAVLKRTKQVIAEAEKETEKARHRRHKKSTRSSLSDEFVAGVVNDIAEGIDNHEPRSVQRQVISSLADQLSWARQEVARLRSEAVVDKACRALSKTWGK